jgi:serine/threonine protein kinase
VSGNLPDLSGRKIGEYELVARVGVGGMGVVYEGKQPLIGKRVAVKVLLPSLSGEQELVERFLAEARAVNEIRHRGIVDIFSFGKIEPEGAHYFVMEFLEGEAFDKLIKRRSPLPLAEALSWADEMLDALDAAHSAGIIHRDIKPSSLFLVNTGRGRPYVKLLDFGIAKLGAIQGEATPQTRASVILGTPDYISPEQARGKPISPQTDLYALGCVLFEMLTGERVFRGENTLQTMWMHVEDQPPVPSSIRPDIPRELDDIILWALEKESTKRPPSAAVMRDQLQVIKASFAPTGQFTPPPNAAAGLRPIANTPPPSGRNRAIGGTPAPRSGAQAPLKTPAPSSRSGSQGSLSGRTRSAPIEVTAPGIGPATLGDRPAIGDGPNETRLQPIALTGSQSLQLNVSEMDPESDSEPVVPPAKSKLPLVLAGVAALLVVGLVALFVVPHGGEEAPKPVDEVVPVDVKKDPPPVEVKKDPPPVEVKNDPPVEVKKDPPPVEVKNDPPPVEVKKDPPPVEVKKDPPPVKKGITTEQLVARLKRIEVQLASKEAETGQKDAVLRQFIDQGRKQIQRASSDAERREAWGFLGDIEGQLKR